MPGRVLLNANYQLTDEILHRLREHDVRTVFVRYPSLSFLERLFPTELMQGQRRLLENVTQTFEAVQNKSAGKLPYAAYLASIEDLVQTLLTHPQSALFLGDIDTTSNDLLRHSSAVAYLSLLLGLKLEPYLVRERKRVDPARAKEVKSLGLGAMLHDVGVTLLPAEVRARYEASGDSSDSEWQEHPALGFAMVRGQIDPSAAAVVGHHHQHFDGTGFAGSEMPILDGHRIHVFARIAAVAVALDELRNPPNLPPRPTVWALSTMLRPEMAQRFDPHVLGALLQVAPPYAPGSMVRLSDGRHAVVIDHNPDQPCRPTVQIMPPPEELAPEEDEDAKPGEMVDLRQVSSRIVVAEAEGEDVSELNFVPPSSIAQLATATAWG